LWTDTRLYVLVIDQGVAAAACALARPLLFGVRGLESGVEMAGIIFRHNGFNSFNSFDVCATPS